MKDLIKKNARIVAFFNRSHVYGGKLAEIAKQLGVTRGLTITVETRWYSTCLMFKSLQSHM